MTQSNNAQDPKRIVASEITIVDRKGRPRITLGVQEDGTATIKMLDNADRIRAVLFMKDTDDDFAESLLPSPFGEVGLLMADRQAGAIRLTIDEDGLVGRRARLEISEGSVGNRRLHRFPPRSPASSD